MIRRLALATALALAVTARPVDARPLAPAVLDSTGSYWVAITMPNRDPAAAMLVLDESGGALRGVLILEGSPAVALDKLSLEGDRLSAELPTSAGIARLTVRLKERSGEGSLVLVAKTKR